MQQEAFGGLTPTVRQRLQRLKTELRVTGRIASIGTQPMLKPGTGMIATMHDGSGMFGTIAGIAGAVIGTCAGHAARLAAIARIGGYPAAIVEDLVAIGLAAFIVTR